MFERYLLIVSDTFNVPVESLSKQTTFFELGADSLDLVDLLLVTESEFDITIEENLIKTIVTIGDAFNLIQSKLS